MSLTYKFVGGLPYLYSATNDGCQQNYSTRTRARSLNGAMTLNITTFSMTAFKRNDSKTWNSAISTYLRY